MLDFSDRAELQGLVDILRPVAECAAEAGHSWILVGAMARDLMLHHARGWPLGRATGDVDLAVLVADWASYQSLRRALIERTGARAVRSQKQRLELPSGDQVDLIPFGDIEERGEIAWPPDGEPILGVHGFREALEHSTSFLLPGGLEVSTPSVGHYFILKLLAWSDRHERKPLHDSEDLHQILNNADELWETEILYEEHFAVLERHEFDQTETALELIGSSVASSLRERSMELVQAIVRAEIDENGRLDLVRELGDGARTIRRLRSFLRGLEGTNR